MLRHLFSTSTFLPLPAPLTVLGILGTTLLAFTRVVNRQAQNIIESA